MKITFIKDEMLETISGGMRKGAHIENRDGGRPELIITPRGLVLIFGGVVEA